jgi:internalin A
VEIKTGFNQWKGLCKLKNLCIKDTHFGDKDMDIINDYKDLISLNFIFTHISDSGLVHLRLLSKLENLSINGSDISDQGLVNLESLKNITRLSLLGNNVTKGGLEHLKGLTKLKELRIGSNIKETDLTELRRALPACTIKIIGRWNYMETL